MRIRLLCFVILLALPSLAFGQQRGQRAQAQRPPSAPTPRYPDGHPMLSAPPGKLGYWDAGTGSIYRKNGNNLPTNLELDEIPFMPWARALYEVRQKEQSKSDPHARCIPPGGPRQFHTPYGLAI